MQFEYDPENLIRVVSKRPGIWDYEHPDYREKKTRQKLWNDIVQELVQTDVNMSKGELRELELQLQKKWKSVRDCFQKYIQNPQKSKRPYIYTKQLQFLLKDQKMIKKTSLPTITIKEDGSVDSVEEEEDRKPRWKPRKKLKISKHDEPSDEEENIVFEGQDDSDDYSAKPTPSSSKMMTHNESGQFAFASVDTVQSTVNREQREGEDPDKMFLMSLLPHLKSIPEEFRLNAKMELMQVLQQANYSIAKLM